MRDAEVVKLRAVARDCLGKHLYSSAIFFAGKLVTVAGNATQDVYMQVGFSVFKRRCKDSITDLTDPRLGTPAGDEECATCGVAVMTTAQVKSTDLDSHDDSWSRFARETYKTNISSQLFAIGAMNSPERMAHLWSPGSEEKVQQAQRM